MFISVRQLCRAWVAYQQRHIRTRDLWVWFAAHELVARRCQVKPGQAVHYTEGELTRLVSGEQNVPQSLRRLADADLLHWDQTQLTFPDDHSPTSEAEAVMAMLEQIPNAQRRIPVPRRMIRYIAGGCPRVSLATLLGHLMRACITATGNAEPMATAKRRGSPRCSASVCARSNTPARCWKTSTSWNVTRPRNGCSITTGQK